MSDTSTTERVKPHSDWPAYLPDEPRTETIDALGRRNTGRTPLYTPEIGSEICDRLAQGDTLQAIISDMGINSRAVVYNWTERYPAFLDAFSRARGKQADAFADDVVHVSDTEEDPRRAKNRMDARMWAAAKLKPRQYGDTKHVQVDHTVTLTDDQLDARLAALSKQAGVVIDGEFDVVVQHDEPEMLECDHNVAPHDGSKDT